MDIAGGVAVVTGASSGIGATVATDLARRGATVAAVARRKDKLDEVVEKCRPFSAASMAVPADISSRTECERVIQEVNDRFGRVDILVNNAGISIHRNAARTTADDVERLMAVNFFAPVYLTTAALPGMLERRQGTVINITSVAGYVPNPGESAYGAAKAALSLWTHGLARGAAGNGNQPPRGGRLRADPGGVGVRRSQGRALVVDARAGGESPRHGRAGHLLQPRPHHPRVLAPRRRAFFPGEALPA